MIARCHATSIEKLTLTAEKIDEAYKRNGQRAHKVVTIEPPASHEGKNDALAADVSRLREQIKAMGIGGIIDHEDVRILSLDPAAVRVRETIRARTEFASIMRGSAIAPRL